MSPLLLSLSPLLSRPLSVSLTLLYILLSLLVVVSFCLLSVSVSFSVSIDRSCIRLLSPLFSLLCFVLGVWVRRCGLIGSGER
jgi:hypothetical protein